MSFAVVKTICASFLVLGGTLFYSPAISGRLGKSTVVEQEKELTLTLRQRTEILFVNGLRNAQKKNDIYSQMQALKKTVSEIARLRELHGKQTPKEEKAIAKRVKELNRMIASESL